MGDEPLVLLLGPGTLVGVRLLAARRPPHEIDLYDDVPRPREREREMQEGGRDRESDECCLIPLSRGRDRGFIWEVA